MRWYEFFAGGGMARLGLGDEWDCAFANEWCPKKAATYTKLFVVGVRDAAPQGKPGFGHTRALVDAHGRLDACVRKRWIWWTLSEPPARTAQLKDLLEEDVANWHSRDETRHLLGLMSERHRR